MKAFLIGCISLLLLTSCSHNGVRPARQFTRLPTTQESLQLAADSNGALKQHYLLQGTERSIADNDPSQAVQILRQIDPQQLSPQRQVDYLIIQAQLALDEKQPQTALTYLRQAQASNVTLTTNTQIKQQMLLTQVYFATHNPLQGLTASSNVCALLPNSPEKQHYLLSIWQKLAALNLQQLQALNSAASNATQQGWIELVLITKNQTIRADELLNAINAWQSRYNNHPAQTLLQSNGMRKRLLFRAPQHIALLLPLNGNLGSQGRAIRNGFLAAYYQAKTSGYAPTVSVLDTSENNITDLYDKATQEGAEIVIGPLLKSDIETLVASRKLTIPTIALNTLPNNADVSNLFQFGLNPEDEVQQVAEKMQSDHKSRVLMITPKNSWGERINTAFEPYWQKLGGEIVTKVVYDSRAELSHQLRQALNLDTSQQRYLNLRWLLKEKIRFVPYRRHDFDAIFLVASPAMGRQIIPLLRFYYAADVPTYSTSHIYAGYAQQKYDHDLEGVIFNDMPWLFAYEVSQSPRLNDIQQKSQLAWPTSYGAYPRLYALGTDAFSLISEISKMSLLPKVGFSNATGELFLETNGKVYRKLTWVKIKNGQAKPLPS